MYNVHVHKNIMHGWLLGMEVEDDGQVSLFHLTILPICNTCCYGFIQDSSSKEGITRKNALASPGV